MNEKKTVLSVILGVALVSLLSAVIAAFADALMLLIDYADVEHMSDYFYQYAVGGVELGLTLIVGGFVVKIAVNKNKRSMLSIIAAAVITMYFLVTLIVLRVNVGVYSRDYYANEQINGRDYTLFTAYLTSSLTITISAIISAVAFVLLARAKKKQEPVAAVAQQENGVNSSVQPAAQANVKTKASGKVFCPQCGKSHDDGKKFCGGCGHKLD